MGTVVDYFNYVDKPKVVSRSVAYTSLFHPKIEMMVENEVKQMMLFGGDVSKIDESVVLSLCFTLSRYLVSMMSRDNDFNLTPSNVDAFVGDLIHEMIISIRKDND